MDIIGDIYRNSTETSERSLRRDKQYAKASNQVEQCYQLLCKILSDKEQETLDKLMACYSTKIERKSTHCFKDGFKAGMAVAVQSFE